MGYLADQRGIINRYLREQGGWDKHLNYCRDYIINKIKEHKPEKVTILGSGWLLDIPLAELSELTGRVTLVDIIHSVQVKHKVRPYKNVSLVEMDISGGLVKTIWQSTIKGMATIDDIDIPVFNPGFDTGLVISVNLLTQLDNLLVDFVSKKSNADPSQLRIFQSCIQEKHIEFLESCPSILITDYIEYIYTHDELTTTNQLIFTRLPETERINKWDWDFDTSGSYYDGKKVVFKVLALDLTGNE
jgi:hypothetical protein